MTVAITLTVTTNPSPDSDSDYEHATVQFLLYSTTTILATTIATTTATATVTTTPQLSNHDQNYITASPRSSANLGARRSTTAAATAGVRCLTVTLVTLDSNSSAGGLEMAPINIYIYIYIYIYLSGILKLGTAASHTTSVRLGHANARPIYPKSRLLGAARSHPRTQMSNTSFFSMHSFALVPAVLTRKLGMISLKVFVLSGAILLKRSGTI